MLNKINKRYLLILAVICILTGNCTLSIDVDDGNAIAAEDDILYVSDGENEGEGTFDNPYNSISKAVNEYNSTVNSEIYIKNGNYVFSEQIELNKDINIVGESKEGTILNGNFETSIFKISKDSVITLTNLTIKNAKDSNSAIVIDSYVYGNLNIDNCAFENNENGVIYHYTYSKGYSISISNSTFSNNKNSKNGGAIYLYSGLSLNISNTLFENNYARFDDKTKSQGGAIYVAGNTNSVAIESCKFINNTASIGSAIAQYCAGDLDIFNSIFINNTSPDINDSCVIYDHQANSKELMLNLKNNTFKNNSLNDKITATGNVKVLYLDKNTRINANDLDKYYGDDYNFKVNLTDLNGNPLPDREIVVTLTNNYDKSITTISNVTNANGIAIIYLKNQKAGKYSVVSQFNGDSTYDDVTTTNTIKIRTENEINVVFNPNSINITEGDSYIVTGLILDEYLQPTDDCDGVTYSISWLKSNGLVTVVEGGSYKVDGNKIVFDIIRCHLETRDEPYIVYFNITDKAASGNVTVSLNKINSSTIDPNIEIIYVSKSGNDETGDATQGNPLAKIQTALTLNNDLGGGKTIMVDEGIFEVSNFNIMGNVTVIGKKSKTVFKQIAGNLGMFEIANRNTVKFVNITFTNGYSTPEPDSLIHVTDVSVLYIENCEFYDNHGFEGGAISVSRQASAYINNSYFHDNDAKISEKVTYIGGAIYVHDPAYLYVANSVFVNNTARDGGAIYLGFGSVADIINSTFEDNSAIITTLREGGGGAIYTRTSFLNITNSTFKHNYADLYGGAIYIEASDLDITDDFDLDVEYPDLEVVIHKSIVIEKSYFENNYVKHGSENKGSAIENAYTSYNSIIMHNSILISLDDYDNYMVLIHNYDENDENHTIDFRNNLWKTNAMAGSPSSPDKVKIVVSTENELIYTGDVIEFTVEFVNSNSYGDISELNESVHDLLLKVIPTIGNVDVSNITIKDNKAKFIYFATTVGSEVISFENVFNHTKCRFNVLDGSNKVNLNHTIDIKVNKTSTITVTFEENVSGNVTISVNDKDYSVEIKDFKAILDIETEPGDYDIKVIYSGDDTYKGFIEKDSFSVEKYGTIISADNISITFNGKFEATLKDADGFVIPGEKINININGTDYEAITDENGIATLDLNLPAVGEYNVITSFDGNKKYNSSQAISKIVIIYTDIELDAQNVVITPVDGSFTVVVTDNNGKALNGVDVSITINGTEYNVKTVNNGQATVDLTDNGLDAGEYIVSVNVLASSVYGASSTTSKITVEKIPAVIKTEDLTVFSSHGEFIAELVDANGKQISNKTLVFELNNKSSEVVTNDKGQAKLSLNLTAGSYKIVVKLKEDKVFEADDSIATINVNSNAVVINAPNITIYSSKCKFTVMLSDVNGNPISSDLIVTINGLSYLVTTGADGSGSINLTLPIGEYQVSTQFRGNNIFNAGNAISTITVLSSIESQDLTRSYKSPCK